jgi:hypothetical protein
MDVFLPFDEILDIYQRNLMKKVYYLLSIPVIYSSFMLWKTPTLSDAIIVAALSSVVGFVSYLSLKYIGQPEQNKELTKLEEELKVERLKLSIEQIRENAVREKALRDARASLTGFQDGKELRF